MKLIEFYYFFCLGHNMHRNTLQKFRTNLWNIQEEILFATFSQNVSTELTFNSIRDGNHCPLIIKLQEIFSRFEQPDLVNKNDSQALGVHLGPHQLDVFFFSKKAQVLHQGGQAVF